MPLDSRAVNVWTTVNQIALVRTARRSASARMTPHVIPRTVPVVVWTAGREHTARNDHVLMVFMVPTVIRSASANKRTRICVTHLLERASAKRDGVVRRVTAVARY